MYLYSMRDKIVRKISKEPICGIYQVTNIINNKIYIGQSIDIERRWNQHKYGKGSIILRNAISKYGMDNFKFEILEEIEFTNKNDVIEELTELEDKWLTTKKPYLKEIGYNQNKTAKINIPIVRPDGYGELISKIKIDNNHCGKPIKQYSLNGEFIMEWKSAAQIERKLYFKSENISACCLRKSKTSNGYIWRFEDDEITENDFIKLKDRKKPIIRRFKQLSLSGSLIKEWNSLKELVNTSEFDNRPIKKCCDGYIKEYKGYKWEWIT